MDLVGSKTYANWFAAIQRQDLNVMEEFIHMRGFNINALNRNNYSGLCQAILDKKQDSFDFILNYSPNINYKNHLKDPLFLAYKNLSFMSSDENADYFFYTLLSNEEMDVNKKYFSSNDTILHFLTNHFPLSSTIIKAIYSVIEKGIDLDVQNINGNTALMNLVLHPFSGNKEAEDLISFFIDKDANTFLANKDGKKLVDFALLSGNDFVLNILDILESKKSLECKIRSAPVQKEQSFKI